MHEISGQRRGDAACDGLGAEDPKYIIPPCSPPSEDASIFTGIQSPSRFCCKITTIGWPTSSCQGLITPLSSKNLPMFNDACGERTVTSPCDESDKPLETREIDSSLQTKTDRHARAMYEGTLGTSERRYLPNRCKEFGRCGIDRGRGGGGDSDGSSNNHHKHLFETGKNISLLSDKSNDQALRDNEFVHIDEFPRRTASKRVSSASRHFQHQDGGAEPLVNLSSLSRSSIQPGDSDFTSAAFFRLGANNSEGEMQIKQSSQYADLNFHKYV